MPGNKARIAHGSMEPKEIEDTMIDFFNKKFDILLSTSIIESGIDLPFVNTIIIHRSDMFGLSALYQLRGRVGRGKIKAYAYLLLPKIKINKTALQRLEVMQSLDRLGAGFSIASSDMDIRGFGNLLGEEQSGHIKEVGIELYQTMLIEAIEELRTNKETEDDYNPIINLGLPMLIPDNYIGDAQIKLSIYKKAGNIKDIHEIAEFKDELIDRFGKMPIEVKNFLILIKFKVKCKKLMIEKLDVSEKAISISFRNNKCLDPEKLINYIDKNSGHMKIRPDQKLVLSRQFSKLEERLNYLEKILDDIS
jgi:transcription-repair coupling factor (superfamily II helicase)